MSHPLTRFKIQGLHKLRTIDIPITDNKLILVGENGTGKSTVATFIYFFLTCQWARMREYQFESVSATIGSEELKVSRLDIEPADAKRRPAAAARLLNRLPQSAIIELDNWGRSSGHEEPFEDLEGIVHQFARRFRIPSTYIRDYLYEGFHHWGSLYSDKLRERESRIRDLVTDQILFLPTYRRIEQDLRAIFPGLEQEVASRIRRRLGPPRGEGSYIEFVEFGMRDVEHQIDETLGGIKDSVHARLNSLTGTYLRDVIKGTYTSAELGSRFENLDKAAMDAMFERIPEAILSESDKSQLKGILVKIGEAGGVQEKDKVIAHFLTQLIDLYEKQQADEKPVKEFMSVCNDYLSGKKLVYDDVKFLISVALDIGESGQREIKMKKLSSGEKQIVSLFSHIYLSGGTGYLVIIDEPELSLSVPWQKRFLPDIFKTRKCNGLVAATHSPFVYDNDLDRYAHALEEFVEDLG